MADIKESTADEGKDKDSVAYQKRREQVRRAQRTHRERKEAYIKSLENEILQQRTNESKIRQEKRHLQSEVGRLRAILDQHGIAYSGPSDAAAAYGISDTSVSSEADIFPLENAANSFHDLSLLSSYGDSDIDSRDTNSPPRSLPLTSDMSTISRPVSQLNLEGVDLANYGPDFMSQLEPRGQMANPNNYYQTPLLQPRATHVGTPPHPLLQHYISHPVSTSNVALSSNWAISGSPGVYTEESSSMGTNRLSQTPEYGVSDPQSSRTRTEEMYQPSPPSDHQHWRPGPSTYPS